MTTPVTNVGRLPVIRYSTMGASFSAAIDISSLVDSEIFDQTDDTILKDTQFDLTCFYDPTLMTAMITAQQASVPALHAEVNPVTWYYAPQGTGIGLPLYTITAWIMSVTVIANMIEIGLMPTGDLEVSVQ